MRTIVGGMLVFLGIILMAGSAGDCDGACMEQANTLGEMMTIIAMGFSAVIGGAILVANGERDNA